MNTPLGIFINDEMKLLKAFARAMEGTPPMSEEDWWVRYQQWKKENPKK